MTVSTFVCIDGHTCGNPVRLVVGGAPSLQGASMSARRQDFVLRYDWIRTALMFEPRGHDHMSGAILYPPCRDDCDTGILYIEVTGCLPMCGHGTIGAVTFALEQGLVSPRAEGRVRLDTPAGVVVAGYERAGRFVERVRLTNVPSYLALPEVRIDCPELGEIVVDIAYGGNFYAIVEPQAELWRAGRSVRGRHPAAEPRAAPESQRAGGGRAPRGSDHSRHLAHHVDRPGARSEGARPQRRVLWREGDRSQPVRHRHLARAWPSSRRAAGSRVGDDFVHESIIGSLFEGRIEGVATVGEHAAIIPSVAGWARLTGLNTIFVDARDPYAHGFQLH